MGFMCQASELSAGVTESAKAQAGEKKSSRMRRCALGTLSGPMFDVLSLVV